MEQCVRNNQPLSEGRLLQLMISVCRGLHAMHIGSLAHRDLKVLSLYYIHIIYDNIILIVLQPANLLLTDSRDELVLMDLGSSAHALITISSRFNIMFYNLYFKILHPTTDKKLWHCKKSVPNHVLLITG